MECYQCQQSDILREAVGVCHHCSAALCGEHIYAVEEPLMVKRMMAPSTVFPKKARHMLCATCKAALEQLHAEPATEEQIFR